MGCSAASGVASSNPGLNLEHKIILLATTNQTKTLIQLLRSKEHQIDINAAINFRGDTLLHYACYKDNVPLVEYLMSRHETLRTVKNYSQKKPRDLATNERIRKLCL